MTSNHHCAVKSGMVAKRTEAEAMLAKEYPIGNYPIFPDKRVWKNKTTGSYFELTPIRIKLWATGIVRSCSLLVMLLTTI